MKVLVDTSVWVDLINAYDSPEAATLAELLAGDAEICTCGVIYAEVLQGLRRPGTYDRVRVGFDDLVLLEPGGLAPYARAAAIFRTLRRQGYTVRSTIDCLIAALAEQHRCFVLHRDRDLGTILASGALDVPTWPAWQVG